MLSWVYSALDVVGSRLSNESIVFCERAAGWGRYCGDRFDVFGNFFSIGEGLDWTASGWMRWARLDPGSERCGYVLASVDLVDGAKRVELVDSGAGGVVEVMCGIDLF